MRGRIIHYNGADGKGLISADQRQIPFEISLWRSDTAPAVNQVVEMRLDGEILESYITKNGINLRPYVS